MLLMKHHAFQAKNRCTGSSPGCLPLGQENRLSAHIHLFPGKSVSTSSKLKKPSFQSHRATAAFAIRDDVAQGTFLFFCGRRSQRETPSLQPLLWFFFFGCVVSCLLCEHFFIFLFSEEPLAEFHFFRMKRRMFFGSQRAKPCHARNLCFHFPRFPPLPANSPPLFSVLPSNTQRLREVGASGQAKQHPYR